MLIKLNLHGCLYLLDWTNGLDYWTRLVDCEMLGLGSNSGMPQAHALY